MEVPALTAEKIRHRIMVMETLIGAVDRWAEISALLANCADDAEALAHLTAAPFSFDEFAAQCVLDLPLRRLTAERRRGLEAELATLRASKPGDAQRPIGRVEVRHESEIADDRAFATPEEAAMAEWDEYPRAEAKVVSVEYTDDDHAIVVIDTKPTHPMWNHCVRGEDGWVLSHDHN